MKKYEKMMLTTKEASKETVSKWANDDDDDVQLQTLGNIYSDDCESCLTLV